MNSESSLTSIFTDNPYFSAGFGLLGVGTGLALLRQGLIRSAGILQRRLLTTLEITSRDPAYPWVLQWITRQKLTSGGHFSLSTSRKLGGKMSSIDYQRFQLVPAPGVHYLRWSGRWIQVARERERSLVDFGGSSTGTAGGGPFETVTLTTIGKAEKVMRSLLEEAEKTNAQMEEGKLVVWTAWGQDWRPFGHPRRRRPLNSVVLSEGLSSHLLSDIKEFLAAEQWYQSRGIPYRRGYLLDGPPGGGKSSLVQALAGELGYNICVLSLSEGWLTDDRFNHLLNSLPEKSFLLLEDIDATGPSRDETASKGQNNNNSGRLSFSGLLNALDGVTSAEERIIFMTTNHRNRLDLALIRPGRVDYHQHIGWADREQACRLFSNFFPDHIHLSQKFGDAIGEARISPAAIQGHFILYKNSPKEAVDNAGRLFGGETVNLERITK